MDRYTGWIAFVLAMLASGALGAFLYAWRRQKNEMAKRRIPRRWPLVGRAMVNSKEHRVWRWLVRSFHDYHVLIKVPVTRFTLPQVQTEGQHWFQILNGVYCTFTICNNEGVVVGCVDVPGPIGFSLSNQTLKHTLLSQCNLGYWVIEPDKLPNTDTIRAAFLGEHSVLKDEDLERSRTVSEFNETRENLKASLLRQRHNKSIVPQPDPEKETGYNGAAGPEPYDSRLPTSWSHDSFVSPLDSRYNDLR